MLSRLDAVTREVDEAMEAYDLARAAQTLRAFAWNDLADWYDEWSKGRLYEGTEQEKADQAELLAFVLERALRLLHPIMPFLTEEIWRALTGGETIMLREWPTVTGFDDPQAEWAFSFLQDVVSALRRFRAGHQIPPATKPAATAVVPDHARRALLESETGRVRALAGWGEIAVLDAAPDVAAEARLVLSEAVIHVPLAGLLDLAAERDRLRRERAKHRAETERIGAKLADPNFTQRAPAEVVDLQRERLEAERVLVAGLDEALRDLG
jgi:valyl-tRNA synthetase